MGDGEGGAGGSAVRSLREASRGGSGNGLGKGRWGGGKGVTLPFYGVSAI